MVCFSQRSDDAFLTGAFGQLWIAVCCVLLGHLYQGAVEAPQGALVREGYSRASSNSRSLTIVNNQGQLWLAASRGAQQPQRIELSDPPAQPHGIDRLLFAGSRLAGFSSSPPRTTTISSSLGIFAMSCTHLLNHTSRVDASVGTESARRVVFARVRLQAPQCKLGSVRAEGAHVVC